jgi:hypothetical protein
VDLGVPDVDVLGPERCQALHPGPGVVEEAEGPAVPFVPSEGGVDEEVQVVRGQAIGHPVLAMWDAEACGRVICDVPALQ